MDTTLRYESNSGAVIRFEPDASYHYSGATLHDYSHSYSTNGGKITQFTDEITDWTLDIVVAGTSAEDRNNMIEAFEYDVLKMIPGKLWSGEYYLECYVTANSKDQWWFDEGYMHASITVTAEKPKWVREFYKVFGEERDEDSTGIDYAHDWSFDYASNVLVKTAKNTSIVSAPFRMTVYGPTTKTVSIIIGSNTYEVSRKLTDGQQLVIDSRLKTITLKEGNGAESNVFSERSGEQVLGSGSYIFEPIPAGVSYVTWDGDYRFELVVYDERSEPRW